MGLQRSASLIFAACVVLPNLLLVFLLARAGLLARDEARIGILVAVLLGALGLFVLRILVGRIAQVARELETAEPGALAERSPLTRPGLVPELSEVTEIAQI